MMKRFGVLLLLGLLSLPAWGREYESSFGFTLEASDAWLVLTPQELKENPELFNFDDVAVDGMDQGLLQRVVTMVKSGQVEFYFHQETGASSFADNINFLKQVGRLPVNAAQLSELCTVLPGELTRMFGRSIRMHQCTLGKAGGLDMLITEFDGMVEGTRSIQYQFHRSPSVLVVATATAKEGTLPMVRAEFMRMMESIRLR